MVSLWRDELPLGQVLRVALFAAGHCPGIYSGIARRAAQMRAGEGVRAAAAAAAPPPLPGLVPLPFLASSSSSSSSSSSLFCSFFWAVFLFLFLKKEKARKMAWSKIEKAKINDKTAVARRGLAGFFKNIFFWRKNISHTSSKCLAS